MNTTLLRWLLPMACALLAVPGHAMYKLIGPDGKVTYTDVPPATTGSRVSAVGGGNAATAAPEPSLPVELRNAVSRYPVTLYAAANCAPCDSARRWLRQRGVPFSEKTVSSNEDIESYNRLTGGSELPAATLGPQVLKGWSADQWSSFLDAAGYPRVSQLPASYQYPAAAPLVARKEAPARPSAAAAPAPAVAPPPANRDGFRF
jgi:glutaredoxin